jgi:hypothetical protein
MHGTGENECKIVMVKSEEIRPVGRHGHRLEYFKMDIKGIGFGTEKLIHLAQRRIHWRPVFIYLFYGLFKNVVSSSDNVR